MKNTNSAEKMGTMPIYKLVLRMSIPPIISLVINSLYNVVDSIYISNFSEVAFTAISLAFPIQIVIIAASSGMGVGINSIVSRRLGEKRYHDANNSAEHGILISVILSAVLMIIGLFFSKYFFGIFSDDPLLIQYGTIYIKIILFGLREVIQAYLVILMTT